MWRLDSISIVCVVVELLDLVFLLFYATMVVGRRLDGLDLLLHGEIFRLLIAEFINGGDFALSLFLADVATPCCGALCAMVSSTSR